MTAHSNTTWRSHPRHHPLLTLIPGLLAMRRLITALRTRIITTRIIITIPILIILTLIHGDGRFIIRGGGRPPIIAVGFIITAASTRGAVAGTVEASIPAAVVVSTATQVVVSMAAAFMAERAEAVFTVNHPPKVYHDAFGLADAAFNHLF